MKFFMILYYLNIVKYKSRIEIYIYFVIKKKKLLLLMNHCFHKLSFYREESEKLLMYS